MTRNRLTKQEELKNMGINEDIQDEDSGVEEDPQ